MEHIQDLGKFDNSRLEWFRRSAIITCDRKAYRKFAEELERRRRTRLALDGGDSPALQVLSTHELISAMVSESTPAHRQ